MSLREGFLVGVRWSERAAKSTVGEALVRRPIESSRRLKDLQGFRDIDTACARRGRPAGSWMRSKELGRKTGVAEGGGEPGL